MKVKSGLVLQMNWSHWKNGGKFTKTAIETIEAVWQEMGTPKHRFEFTSEKHNSSIPKAKSIPKPKKTKWKKKIPK